MRFPVFARGSNPAIDRPILHKSQLYVEQQVADYLADWVDPDNHTKGIVAREYLRFGERALPPDPVAVEKLTLPRLELPGLKFQQPITQPQRNLALMRWHWEQSEAALGAAV